MGGSYPSVEVQSVYSIAPADWVIFTLSEKTKADNNHSNKCSFKEDK